MRWISAASLVLVLASGPRALAQPAPGPLSLLDVPFISQSEALCGGAAAAMIVRFWGARGVTAESFAHLVDRSAAGIRTDALIAELRGRGWNATGIAGSEALLSSELARGRPVLLLIEDRPGTYHYIVAVAETAGAIVFHDPARAPTRVMSREEFTRRWSAADRWMAVVVPGETPPDALKAVEAPPPAPADACSRLVSEGVTQAQANDLVAAERSLVSALACPGGAPLRELAGVRLLQRRWADVESLASAAVAADPHDEHAWRLLGTSRFLQDDRLGALDAWNQVSEPRVDLIAVAGLTHTRQRVVEELIAEAPGDVLTRESFLRARRRADELPSALSTLIEYVPVSSSLVELRVTINERPPVPTSPWAYAMVGATAAARREIEYSVGSLTGGGERLSGAWRFWPGRPRVSVSLAAPAPWGGIWEVRGSSERQPFDLPIDAAERTTADVAIAQWVSPFLRVGVRGGVDDWSSAGTFGVAGLFVRYRSLGDRLDVHAAADGWGGAAGFSMLRSSATLRSSTSRQGWVVVGRAGAGIASGQAPLDTWFGGDTGDTRPSLLRAHPIVDDGQLLAGRLGRGIVNGSVEGQRWWRVSLARVAAAAFVDSAAVGRRLERGTVRDADAGIGLRLALPGLRGEFRADGAKSLRDGATAFSFVYEP